MPPLPSYEKLWQSLLKKVSELERENEELRTSCEEKCKQLQIDQLLSEFNIPQFLLVTDYAKEVIAEGDLDAIRKVLEHRSRLLHPELKIVQKINEEGV